MKVFLFVAALFGGVLGGYLGSFVPDHEVLRFALGALFSGGLIGLGVGMTGDEVHRFLCKPEPC